MMFYQLVRVCWCGCIDIDLGISPNGILSWQNVIVAAFAHESPFGILSLRNVDIIAFACGSGYDMG